MKAYRYIYTGLLTALLIGWGCLLMGCSDQAEIGTEQPDSPQPEEPKGEPLRVASLTRGDGDTDATADPMKGEYVYLFLAAQGETTASSGSVLYKGKNDTSTGNDITWGASGALYVKPGHDYEVYGFLPADEATGTTDPRISFSGDEVTMNIYGLDAVAKKEICVVIGANTVGQTITPGVFGYHAPENTEIGYGVDLLADHLYASAKFQFKVHADYDKLRTIKLKTVELKTASSMYAKVDATITLTKGNANPITNVVFQDNGSGTVDVELFNNDAGYELKVDETKDLMIYFDPAYKGDLVLKSTYDVYDKQGHLLREDCTAENGLGSVLSSIVRGKQIVIPLTVQPTYIYILSESDADWNSPTVSFN